jgi:hypothetical protein
MDRQEKLDKLEREANFNQTYYQPLVKPSNIFGPWQGGPQTGSEMTQYSKTSRHRQNPSIMLLDHQNNLGIKGFHPGSVEYKEIIQQMVKHQSQTKKLSIDSMPKRKPQVPP